MSPNRITKTPDTAPKNESLHEHCAPERGMSAPKVDVLSVMAADAIDAALERQFHDDAEQKARASDAALAAVAELIADANRWRAVTAVYGGFQSRGNQMVAYISTPQWLGDWSDFNNAIDRHFEINDAPVCIGGAA